MALDEIPTITRTDSLESATSSVSSACDSLFSRADSREEASRRSSNASSLFDSSGSFKSALSDQSTPVAEVEGAFARPQLQTRSSYKASLAASIAFSMASLNVSTPHANQEASTSNSVSSEGFPWASGGVISKHQAAYGTRKSRCFVATTSDIFGDCVEDADSEDEGDTDSRHRSPANNVSDNHSLSTIRQQSKPPHQRPPMSTLYSDPAVPGVASVEQSTSQSTIIPSEFPPAHFTRNSSDSNMFRYSPPAAAVGPSVCNLRSPNTATSVSSVGSRHVSIDPYGSAPSSARPLSSASSVASGSIRPWIRDSDAASVRSAGNMSYESSITEEVDGMSVKSPLASLPCPFLSKAPPPKNCKIVVDSTQAQHFLVTATLPGFNVNNITLALKRSGALHIIADRYEDSRCPSCFSSASSSSASRSSKGSTSSQDSLKSCNSDHGDAHYERLVELGPAAFGGEISATFNDRELKIKVKKRQKRRPEEASTCLNYH